MKNLILIRHAKSSWQYDVIDHERPLNEKGIQDAHMVSSHLALKKMNIDTVLCSDAVRTKTTADIFFKNLKIDQSLMKLDDELYDFSGNNLIRVIKRCPDSVNHLMIFCHNHAITSFVNTYGDKYIENVPTCGVVSIEFAIENWKELTKGKTVSTLFPRDLRE
ncbi:SixA phosphatase family protein [Mariniflexile sp. AS56]|uniref:SixA phosphatase family protein n=1 Tax=Mariniflexile sp. AS56 TaxID=3063957 RepID=UPI0026F26C4C|nr:histidine phosphatase family protein [Mariniflexile sp. AS56]MDO7173607.1 histidine phosphatase family protein [Mariniflexile sp. AS56]